jgi:peroxiredoxin
LILIVVLEDEARILFAKIRVQNMVVMESQVVLKKGDIAPDFALMGVDGKKHSLASYGDYEAVLVIFMCNHCPYVKAKVGAIDEIATKFKGKVAVVGINSNDSAAYPDDSFENMKKFAAERGIRFFYLVDETQQVAKKYGAVCTPDPFLFDKERRLAFHGRIDNAMKPEDKATEKTMIANIEKLLDGQQIAKDFDPSIGCSIKWKN